MSEQTERQGHGDGMRRLNKASFQQRVLMGVQDSDDLRSDAAKAEAARKVAVRRHAQDILEDARLAKECDLMLCEVGE